MVNELEHDLAVLVELDLYTRIRAIRDGKFPDEKEMIEETVKSFENGLPLKLKQISNYHDIIIHTLEKVEQETKRIKQLRQKEKHEKNGQER